MAGNFIPPAVIEIIGQDRGFQAVIARDTAILAKWAATDTQTKLGATSAPFQTTLTQVKGELLQLAQQLTRARIGADASTFWTQIAVLRAEVEAMSPLDINVDAHVGTALAQITALRGGLASAQTGSLIASALGGAAGGGGDSGGGGGGGIAGLLAGLGWGKGKGMGIPGLSKMASFGSVLGMMGFGAEHVVTSGIGVAGSLAGAGIGGGLLGAGALGVGGVGMGTDLAGMGQAAGDIKAVYTAQQQLNQAMAQYGPLGYQYAAAQQNLNSTLAGFSPIAQQAVTQAAATAGAFKTLFDQVTGQAEKTGAQIINQVMQVGMQFLPTIGKFAAENMKIIQSGMQPIMKWLTSMSTTKIKLPGLGSTTVGTGGLAIFTNLEQLFQKQLPTAIAAGTQAFEWFGKTIDVAGQYTGGFMRKMDNLFTHLNKPGVFSAWAVEIGKLIGLFRAWVGAGVAAGKVIVDIFKPAVGFGEAFAGLLTRIFNQLNSFLTLKSTQSALHSLFSAHLEEVIKGIGGAISDMMPLIEGLALGFIRVATAGARIVSFALKPLDYILHAVFDHPVIAQIAAMAAEFFLVSKSVSTVAGLVGSLGTIIAGLVGKFAALPGLMSNFSSGLSVGNVGSKWKTFGTDLSNAGLAAQNAAPNMLNLSTQTTGLVTSVSGSTGVATMKQDIADLGTAASTSSPLVANMGASASTAGEDIAATGAKAETAAGGLLGVSSSIADMAGPIGFAAAGLTTLLVPAFMSLFNHGPSAAQATAAAVANLNKALASIPQGSIPELMVYIDNMQGRLAAVNTQMQNLNPSSQGFTIAAGKATDLRTKLMQAQNAITTMATQTGMLSNAFGVSTSTMQSEAQTLGPTLQKAYDPAQIKALAAQMAADGSISKTTAWIITASAGQMAAGIGAGVSQAESYTSQQIADTQIKMALMAVIMGGGGALAIAQFVNSVQGGLPAVTTALADVGGSIPTKYMSLLQGNLTTGGKVSIAGLATAISEGQPGASTAMEGVNSALTSTANQLSSNTKNAGNQAMIQMAQAIVDHDPDISTNTKTVLDHAITTMQTYPGQANTVGIALSQGIASGLISQSGAVSAAAAKVVNDAIAAATSAGQIKSPSRLTAEMVGLPLAQGVMVGIQKGTSGAVGAMTSLVHSTAGVRSMPGSYGTRGAGGVSVANTYQVTINAGGGNPQQISSAFKQVAQEHTDELIRRLRAGTIAAA